MRKLQWSKIEEDKEIKAFVIEHLRRHWNPDEIAGYLKRRKKKWYVSKTAIYEWLRTSRGERYCICLYSKRKRVKRRKEKTRRALIPNRVDISKRFAGANNRSRYGHVESDTVVGRKGTPGGMKTVLDRKSRLVMARKVGSMKPLEHADAEKMIFRDVKVLSVTRDNGIENKDHEKVGVPSFFCRPYASWQKGGVEHANKMLRRYFPKGTDFRDITQKNLDEALVLINEKPRKILGYRSALEVAKKAGIIKCIKS
jgi:IS30 family transposase